MSTPDDEPPFEGGSQPVPHRKDEVPRGGRSVVQMVTVVLGVLAVLAAALWFLSPLLAGE